MQEVSAPQANPNFGMVAEADQVGFLKCDTTAPTRQRRGSI
jgi:hypothetical protein